MSEDFDPVTLIEQLMRGEITENLVLRRLAVHLGGDEKEAWFVLSRDKDRNILGATCQICSFYIDLRDQDHALTRKSAKLQQHRKIHIDEIYSGKYKRTP